jgi:hypothetical protein
LLLIDHTYTLLSFDHYQLSMLLAVVDFYVHSPIFDWITGKSAKVVVDWMAGDVGAGLKVE